MRRWHKLLAPWFALLLVVVAFTGAVTQATAMLDGPPPASEKRTTATQAAGPREKRSATGAWNHWFKKIHSGEALGPVGILLNLATGLALVFFAGSGLWMYVSMWVKRRRNRRRRPG